MEAQLINEFVNRTGASPSDAMACLSTWGWDLKRALTDYNDTSTNDYLNNIQSGQSPPPSYSDGHAIGNAAHNPLYSKLPLNKTESTDVDCKKLERGISRAIDNDNIVSRARNEMAIDFQTNLLPDLEKINLLGAPYYTFTLPDLSVYSEEFRKFIEKDLIENSTLTALESSQRLNWWASAYICQRLWPLATTGDGNCLLHAASLGMWGFHDRKLTLRTALHDLLSLSEYRDALWRRWRFQQTRLNKQAGFVYSDYEWAKEWDEIVVMASPEPRNQPSACAGTTSSAGSRRRSFVIERGHENSNNATYESLEEIHILALAHVLRRTIIVVSDTMLRDMNGEAMSPITFGGIYLPFEIPPAECHRSPLLLTYDTAHFSALVPMDSQSEFPPSLIPLVDCENKLLPIQFCIDPGQQFDWRSYDGSDGSWSLSETEHVPLLKEYLDVMYALNPSSPDDEIYEDYWTDEETDPKRQFADAEVVLSDGDQEGSETGRAPNEATKVTAAAAGNKKATKQLQSVAKQFGSIGKNMSKKIKKNFGNITSNFKQSTSHPGSTAGGQLTKKGSNSSSSQRGGSINKFSKVLCAELKTKRHEYQQEMVSNYLECAHMRFRELHGDVSIKDESPASTSPHSESIKPPAVALSSLSSSPQMRKVPSASLLNQPQTVALTNTPTSLNDSIVNCINAGCQNFGTSTTCYMCSECFERQKKEEAECKFVDTSPRYGTGNSKFYTQTDLASHNQVQKLPPVRRLHELDQTLYLSNSTFFNDKLAENHIKPMAVVGQNSAMVEQIAAAAPPPVKVIQHKILVEGQDYNRTRVLETLQQPREERRPIPPVRRESQRNAIYFPNRDSEYGTTDTVDGLRSGSMNNSHLVATPFLQLKAQPCQTIGCTFFGNASTNNYCSKCCRQRLSQQTNILTDV